MPFNSLNYFIFLSVIFLLFFFAGERLRWIVLLVASLLFYSALNVPYLPIVLVLVATTTYSFGIWLDEAESDKSKRTLLWSGITVNVLILVVMKYLPFLSENMKFLANVLSLDMEVKSVKAFVAIGTSYYIFQSISYLSDIYLDKAKPERHFGYFSLYLTFFPKLLQGPIERATDLLPQLKNKYEFSYDNMRTGMLLFTWGLFKKVVIADRLALFVNNVYGDLGNFTGINLLLASWFYSFQIYCDFSGYTDMAIGSALLFNIQLTKNFNSPYLATNVADFWKRWHISFSRWIMDYIYYPLAFKTRYHYKTGVYTSLIITFTICGIWHGASWSFLLWGLLHGMYMVAALLYRPIQKKIYQRFGISNSWLLNSWQIFCTFNLISFAWIFFRSSSISDAWYVVTHLHVSLGSHLSYLIDFNRIQHEGLELGLQSGMPLAGNLIAITALFVSHILASQQRFVSFFNSPGNRWFRWIVYMALVLLIINFGVSKEIPFAYNKF